MYSKTISTFMRYSRFSLLFVHKNNSEIISEREIFRINLDFVAVLKEFDRLETDNYENGYCYFLAYHKDRFCPYKLH